MRPLVCLNLQFVPCYVYAVQNRDLTKRVVP